MLKFAVIIGSVRPGRVGPQVGQWVFTEAKKRSDAEFELVDLMDFDLPLLDEPLPAQANDQYAHAHTRAWSEVIREFDGYIFVTPEYNHGMPGSLKNALDFLYKE